jgi:adenosine deaminase CECR1
VAALENVYESVLLNARRIGHGLGFIKHPYLLQLLKKKNVAFEICITSNQILGLVTDVRNHPAINYHRMGIPIVLGSDDAGAVGTNDFTVDWYEAYLAWGLDLADLRQLAINSLMFSSMSDSEKEEAIYNKWQPKWNEYVMEKRDYACSQDFTQEEPYFGMLLPKESTNSGSTKVNVYGRHFESAICNEVLCKFGDKDATQGHYVSQNHIICYASHSEFEEAMNVSVQVSLDGGSMFYTVQEHFTYRSQHRQIESPQLGRRKEAEEL